MKKNTGWIIVALVLVTGGGYLVYRYIKNSKKVDPTKPDGDATKKSTTTPVTTVTVPPSLFPLRKGSPKSDAIKALQSAIGVTADGIFGPKTEAALQAKTGKTQVSSQAEYDAIVSQSKQSAAIPSNQNRAKDMLTRWRSDNTMMLMAISDVTAYGYIQDFAGALTSSGKNITLKAGQKLNRTDYIPIGYTNQGFLEFKITSGTLAGNYKVDPNKITLSGAGSGVMAGISLADALSNVFSSL